MEEKYQRDKACERARAMLSLLNVNDADLEKFDQLCKEFDLTVEDVVDWQQLDTGFFNPQEC